MNATYQRLPGKGRSATAAISTRHRLWLGPDHLLAVANHGYSEEYKRFYFKDIQTILVRKTRAGAIWNAAFGAWATAFLTLILLGLYQSWPQIYIVSLAVYGIVPALVCLAVNTAKGPTCATYLRTAVQTERLYALGRQRPARRAMARIRQAVEAVQGTVGTDELEAYLAGHGSGGAGLGTPAVAAGLRPYRGHAHAALFAILLVDALHTCLHVAFHSAVVYLLGLAVGIVMVVLMIRALIRQANSDLSPRLKRLTWVTLAYVILCSLMGTLAAMAFAIRNPPRMATVAEPLAMRMWMVSPLDEPMMMVSTGISFVGATGLGIIGLHWVRQFGARRPVPPALPPPVAPS